MIYGAGFDALLKKDRGYASEKSKLNYLIQKGNSFGIKPLIAYKIPEIKRRKSHYSPVNCF